MKEEQQFPGLGSGYLKSLGKIGPPDRYLYLEGVSRHHRTLFLCVQR